MLLEEPSILKNLDKEQISEQNLIESAKRDPKNFRPLYDRHYKEIFYFVLNKTNNGDIAADISSQVFLKALENIKDFEYRGLPFSTWLYRIAINECNQFFRKNSRLRHVVLDQPFIESLFTELENDGGYYEDLVPRLKKAIQQLKPGDLTVIELRFFDQKSFKDVGQILEITENNAKVKLYRALDKLKKLMQK